ncbi:MAG: hypothetical protein JNK25_02620 [Phycisphaerae bacterium]|nr:hypothetical protein [Phycisphaerae bacterium]
MLATSFDGSASLGVMDRDNNTQTSFVFDRRTGVRRDVPIPAGYTDLWYNSISGNSRTLVGYTIPQENRRSIIAVEQDGVMEQRTPSFPHTSATAEAVSHDGGAFAGRFRPNDSTLLLPFRWSSTDGYVPLSLFSFHTFCFVEDMSGDGRVVVGSSGRDVNSEFHAARWWPDGRVEALRPLPGSPFGDPAAYAVSFDGSFVVGSSGAPNFATRAARWDASGTPLDLGVLDGLFDSEAYDVSDDGSVVVGYCSLGSRQTPFVWTESLGRMMALSDYLEGHGVAVPAGWRLEYCFAVSGDGMTFGGSAIDTSGVRMGYVATVPAPAGAGVLAGLLSTASRRRRTPSPVENKCRAAI